jgi:hypothetical protein
MQGECESDKEKKGSEINLKERMERIEEASKMIFRKYRLGYD